MFHFSEKYNLIPDWRNVFIGISKYNVSIFYSGVWFFHTMTYKFKQFFSGDLHGMKTIFESMDNPVPRKKRKKSNNGSRTEMDGNTCLWNLILLQPLII